MDWNGSLCGVFMWRIAHVSAGVTFFPHLLPWLRQATTLPEREGATRSKE